MRPGQNASWQLARSAWRTIILLTVVAMLCRAAVPVGYMPGPAADPSSKLLFTLCSGSGPAGAAPLAIPGESGDPSSDHESAGLACPFGVLASQAAAPGLPPRLAVAPPAAMPTAAPAARQTLPPFPPFGPPLGSRAPPSHRA